MARQRLSADDYAAMAVAAEEMAGRSVGVRKEMNKALQQYYRALSVRDSVAAEKREVNQVVTGEVCSLEL
ncbi:hypothetical protein HBO32_30910 [Pseudomonas nitroreducens]|uniref:hypothetical protein n=1 Tax=Pseudomonas nitroreducens TaxID=46680 RepID=UPI0014765DDB|nr:hypothetical protein [Pseudomonas nitroreducens]NMZ77510.1 hypothetical protein [Pseudomonas nitroreducens]